MNFFRTPFFLPYIYPTLVWKADTNAKDIFLTFDDGPVPGPTDFVLDTLREFQAKATFFCIGDNIARHPALFERVLADGHRIGNHTHHHLNGWKSNTDVYLTDTALCQREINRHLQHPENGTPLFRPPYGRITRKQIHALAQYKIVMWDVLTFDYDSSISPARCLNGAVNAVRPGSIIVFHDSIKAMKNMSYALPLFLKHFSSLGFKFLPLA